MLKSLFSGVTGLQSHQIAMDVESNNIANVNTIGYKYSRANFSDLLAQTNQIATAPQGALGGKNPVQIGLGASVNSVTRIFSQGSIQNTDKNTDVAIQGDGFFIVSSDGGSTYKYSRSGDFKFDGAGNFVDNNGFIVQGWLRDKTTGLVDSTAPIANIQIPPGLTTPASATNEVVIKANLSSGDHVDQFKPIYTLDSVGTDLNGPNGISGTSDDDRPENFNVLFNATGDALNLQDGQGMWVSYKSASLTKTLTASGPADVIASFTINGQDMNVTIPANSSAASVVATISAKINSFTSVTGVSSIPSASNPADIILSNDNTRGTTGSTKNINLTITNPAGTGLTAGTDITSFQYSFVQSGPVPIIETDASTAARQFTTTEDLRVKMQYDANLVGDDHNFNIPGTAQVDTITVAPYTAIAGENFTWTDGVNPISVIVPTDIAVGANQDAIAAALAAKINALPEYNATSVGGNITVTSATAGTAFTGTLGGAAAPRSETFAATFNPTVDADTITFDGVSVTMTAGNTNIQSAAEFVAAYNGFGNFTAVDNFDGTVTFTANVAQDMTDIVSGDFVITSGGGGADTSVTAASPIVNGFAGIAETTTTPNVLATQDNIINGGITVEINARGQFDIKNPGAVNDNYDMRVNVTGLTGNGVVENTRFTQNFQTLAGTLTVGSSISRLSQSFNAASHSASIDVFDSLGTKHTLRLDFRKTELLPSGGSTWVYEMSVPAPGDIGGSININELLGADAGRISFDNNGALAVATTTSISYTANNGSAPNQTINLNFGTIGQYDGITSFDNPSGTSGISQDGFPGGDLLGIRIDQSGTLIGSFSNGRSFGLAQIGMAKFSNNEGLVTDGGNVYLQSANSGDPIIGTAATAGRGFMQSSSLEASNVDLSKSLTNLIIIQRGYQANAKTITTSDTLLETLLGIKR